MGTWGKPKVDNEADEEEIDPATQQLIPIMSTTFRKFRDGMWSSIASHLESRGITYLSSAQLRGRLQGLLKHLDDAGKLPVIIFGFSIRMLENQANELDGISFVGAEERRSHRRRVEVTYARALRVLSPSDRSLPQVQSAKDRALRGVGVHHSGILASKEVTEILMQHGCIKGFL